MTDYAPLLQEITAEAEQKLAALQPAERELALKAAKLRAGSSRRCGRGSSGSGLKRVDKE